MQHNEAYWKMRRKMVKDLGDRIDEMQAEKESTETVVKPDIIKHFQELRQKTDEVMDKLNKLKDAGENTRENIKERAKQVVKDLKAVVDDALSMLEEISGKYKLLKNNW